MKGQSKCGVCETELISVYNPKEGKKYMSCMTCDIVLKKVFNALEVKKHIAGREIKQVIFIPGKLVNIITGESDECK